MSHEELLTKIDAELATNYADECGNFPTGLKALRAVVELHKPTHFIKKDGVITEMWCVCGGEVLTKYPCPTIQAIEKALQ